MDAAGRLLHGGRADGATAAVGDPRPGAEVVDLEPAARLLDVKGRGRRDRDGLPRTDDGPIGRDGAVQPTDAHVVGGQRAGVVRGGRGGGGGGGGELGGARGSGVASRAPT